MKKYFLVLLIMILFFGIPCSAKKKKKGKPLGPAKIKFIAKGGDVEIEDDTESHQIVAFTAKNLSNNQNLISVPIKISLSKKISKFISLDSNTGSLYYSPTSKEFNFFKTSISRRYNTVKFKKKKNFVSGKYKITVADRKLRRSLGNPILTGQIKIFKDE